MGTRLTFRRPLPFSEQQNKDEIKSYMTTQGFTVVSITTGLNDGSVSVELEETLNQSQKDTLQTQIEGDVQFVVYE
jgi:hypothetical protein